MSAAHKPHGHLPWGEVGKGNYGRILSAECIAYLDPVRPYMLDLVRKERAKAAEKVFAIGDYGCADASTSVHLIRAIIEIVRAERGDNLPITVIYEDQVSNDFNSVFNRLHGIIDHPRSYLPDFKNVFTSATGSSFYEQCVPNDSLDLIMAFLAPHWLPSRPTIYKNTIYRFEDATEEERAVVAEQGAKAWQHFLLQRAKELKPGGLLFVSTPCEDPDRSKGQAYIGNEDMLRSMNKVWKRYKEQGKISEEEYQNANLNYCQRTKAEFSAPFQQKDSPVVKAGLKLLDVKICHVETLFTQRWRESKDTTEDRMAHARGLVTAHRPWGNSSFLTALKSSRSAQEKTTLVDGFYEDLIQDLGPKSPKDYMCEFVVGYVFVQKVL